jgi:hypothetical protein
MRRWRDLVVLAAAVSLTLAGSVTTVAVRHGSGLKWDARILDIVHSVEHTRGLTFKRPVRLRYLSDAQFNKQVDIDSPTSEEERAQLQTQVEELRALGVVSGNPDLVAATNKLSDTSVVGLYQPRTKTLYVRGTQLTIDVRVTVAHELTHALQDQYFNLRKLQRASSEGADAALRSLAEGDAVRTEEAYLHSLPQNDQDAYEKSTDRPDIDAKTADVPEVIKAQLAFPYVFGPTFVQYLYDQGGTRQIDKAFRHVPVAEAQIVEPERFPLTSSPQVVAAPSLASGAVRLDRGEAFGQVSLFEVFGAWIGYAPAWSAVQGWQGDSSLPYRLKRHTCFAIDVAVSAASEAGFVATARSWAGHVAAATVTPRGSLVQIRACDPGKSAPAAPKLKPSAFEVLAARAQVINALVTQAVGPYATAECIADYIIATLGPKRYAIFTSPDTASAAQLGELRAAVARGRARC